MVRAEHFRASGFFSGNELAELFEIEMIRGLLGQTLLNTKIRQRAEPSFCKLRRYLGRLLGQTLLKTTIRVTGRVEFFCKFR